MPTHHPTIPPAPKPTKIFFDPFNSSSTGHQTAPSRMAGTKAWRDSRGYKLSHQFSDESGHSGSEHLSDLVGAGSENYRKDGRKENGDWEKNAPGLRPKGWQDIRDLMHGSRKRPRNETDSDHHIIPPKKRIVEVDEGSHSESDTVTASNVRQVENLPDLVPSHRPQIFRGLTIYMNGSTAPLVSDHRLKQLIAIHGGNTSLALGRRTVTHVILGKTCGGGLAAGKMHKEATTVGGKGIKFVTAQWVLDSIKKGVKQPEGRYQPASVSGKIGGSGQKSVACLFSKNQSRESEDMKYTRS